MFYCSNFHPPFLYLNLLSQKSWIILGNNFSHSSITQSASFTMFSETSWIFIWVKKLILVKALEFLSTMSKFRRWAQGRYWQQRSPFRIFRRKSIICESEKITAISYQGCIPCQFSKRENSFTKNIKYACHSEEKKNPPKPTIPKAKPTTKTFLWLTSLATRKTSVVGQFARLLCTTV